MSEPIIAGIDVGTTGVRCILFDLQGTPVFSRYQTYPSYFPGPGWVEHDPDELLAAVFSVCGRCIEESGVDSSRIIALGLSSQRSVLVPVRRDGTAVRRLISWQDNRCTDEVGDMAAVVSGGEYYKTVGLPLGTTWLIPKILWLRKHEPQTVRQTDRYVQVIDFVLHALGADKFHTDISSCVFYGVWDIQKGDWNESLLAHFGLCRDQLGVPTRSGTVVGRLSESAAQKTGLKSGTPLCMGGGDQNCATLGLGAIEPGVGTVTLGTCGMAILSSDKPVSGFGGMMITNHPVSSMWGIEGLTNAAACAYKWFHDNVGAGGLGGIGDSGQSENSYDALNRLAAQSPPGSRGVFFLPYLSGMASPRWIPQARGAFLNLGLASTRADMARSVMEGVVFEIKEILQTWKQAGYSLDSVRITGGATQSALWNQIQADIYGVPAVTLRSHEATCLGAAIGAAVGAKLYPSWKAAVDSMVKIDKTYEPQEPATAIYQEQFEQWLKLSDRMNEGVRG